MPNLPFLYLSMLSIESMAEEKRYIRPSYSRFQITLKNMISYLHLKFKLKCLELTQKCLKCGYYKGMRFSFFQIEITKKVAKPGKVTKESGISVA